MLRLLVLSGLLLILALLRCVLLGLCLSLRYRFCCLGLRLGYEFSRYGCYRCRGKYSMTFFTPPDEATVISAV